MRPTNPPSNQIRLSNTTPNQSQIRLATPNQSPQIRLNLNQAQQRNMSPSFQAVRPQAGPIRTTSPVQQLRPPTVRTPNQQLRPQNSMPRSNTHVRGGQPRATGQIGQPRNLGQQPGQRPVGPRMIMLNQVQQLQQKVANNQGIDLKELDIVSICYVFYI